MNEENSLVRLIWDFKGTDANKIAAHHAEHLREFFQREKEDAQVGFESVSEMHCIAFAEVSMTRMIELRDALRPNRGEYVD